ncbi:MAG: 23S rRNA (uracil(1939)-C(5))-methyltransferase RlmD [Candidatus Cloacimonetes bacterium]|nr:23S rRNA (uracil(1939)-C(5))-methyltransferase RlmD [Candidatus Cloacimonadota bacterium]
MNLKIEKHALGGYGLGWQDGKAVFVPYAHPGDEVEIRLERERKDVAFASVQSYLMRSEIPPQGLCDAFGPVEACGGCDWQDISYASQLRYKHELLSELFRNAGFEADIKAFVPSPHEFNYRNKAFMPVYESERGLSFGIYKRGSHLVVPHKSCRIHPPIFDTLALRTVQLCHQAGVQPYDENLHTGHLRHIGFRINREENLLLLILVTRTAKLPFWKLLVKKLQEEFPALTGVVQNINRQRGNVILGDEEKLLWGKGYLTDTLAGKQFRIQYNSFWQINTALMELIIEKLRKEMDAQCTLIDAFSGCGSIGISLADKTRQTICIESNPASVLDGEFNALQNGVANIGFVEAPCEDALPALMEDQSLSLKPLNIILDPPRSGLQQPVLEALIASQAEKIFYLSCSPITLVRDLKTLCMDGPYRLVKLQPFDMFPQTWHIECLARLERKA